MILWIEIIGLLLAGSLPLLWVSCLQQREHVKRETVRIRTGWKGQSGPPNRGGPLGTRLT